MSALVVQDRGRHGLLALVDTRPKTQVQLVCGPQDSAAVVVVPAAPPDRVEEPEPHESAPPKPKEYWPYMLRSADDAFEAEGFLLVVDTSLLPQDALTFRVNEFITRGVAYASEGYSSIQIQPDDAEEWGVVVSVIGVS